MVIHVPSSYCSYGDLRDPQTMVDSKWERSRVSVCMHHFFAKHVLGRKMNNDYNEACVPSTYTCVYMHVLYQEHAANLLLYQKLMKISVQRSKCIIPNAEATFMIHAASKVFTDAIQTECGLSTYISIAKFSTINSGCVGGSGLMFEAWSQLYVLFIYPE